MSFLFQALSTEQVLFLEGDFVVGVPPDSLRRVILTASGGAFRDFSTEELLELNKNDPELVRKKATTHPHCSWWKRPAGPHRGQRLQPLRLTQGEPMHPGAAPVRVGSSP